MGVRLKFDKMTLNEDYGHFARMLINVELSKLLSDSLILEIGEDCLFTSLDYKNLSSCYSIGHVASTCHRAKKSDPKEKASDKRRKETEPLRVQNVYRPKDKPNEAQKMLQRFRMSQCWLSL